MRTRLGATLLLAAALTIAGPGVVALQAGEAPEDRGRPSDSPSSARAPETPPGQDSDDPDGGGTNEPGQDGVSPNEEPADTGSGQEAGDTDPQTGTGPDLGSTTPPEPPPPPEPDLTGTRVLRSHLGAAREVDDGDASVALRDLRVVVTETEASGIDGGWWVTVTAPDGEVAVTPPSLHAVGGGVPRAPEEVSLGGGPLFWITGQRSGQRYQGLYEAQGTLATPLDDETARPVITILLVQ